MSKSYINIDGQSRDAADLTFPASSRTFREAWQFNGKVVEVDMVKARNIWRDKIRQARTPEFEKLDAQFMKALETGADTSEIVAQKQALRDAPDHPDIESAQTPEELMQVHPAGLTVDSDPD